MSAAPHRLTLKLYFADGVAVDPPRFLPLFHEWIRTGAVEGMLIDVADYKHAREGPATVLIGHEQDYAIDLSGGRPGLMITRKRPAPAALGDDVRQSLRRLLVAARALEAKADPHPPVRLRTDEIRLQVIDRLRYPGTGSQSGVVQGEVERALADVYPGAGLTVEPASDDPRQPITLRARARGAPPLATLLSRLGG